MPLFKQDILRTNKRYVTKIIANDVPTETSESITIGLTGSAFLNPDFTFLRDTAKLHSVMSTCIRNDLSPCHWAVRWGNGYTAGTYGTNSGDCLFANGVNSTLFFEPRFSHTRTGELSQQNSGTITISLDNSANGNSTENGTIILEFTI